MHTLRFVAFLILGLFSLIAHAQTALNDKYRIFLTVNGRLLSGSQERAIRTAGQSSAQVAGIYDAEPPITITSGQTFQAIVKITDPFGVTTDYTRSARLIYESFDCLSVDSLGMVTVVPITGGLCSGPDFPELWISFNDASGIPIAVNAYLFRVVRP